MDLKTEIQLLDGLMSRFLQEKSPVLVISEREREALKKGYNEGALNKHTKMLYEGLELPMGLDLNGVFYYLKPDYIPNKRRIK